MPLSPGCPRCAVPLLATPDGESPRCADHGVVEPLWRPGVPDYAAFSELVRRCQDAPVYLPWPMSPGWSLAQFGCVQGDGPVRASVTTIVGASDLDGPVEVTVVAEDPGVGLGSRCGRTPYADPGEDVGQGPPAAHVRAGARQVPLWLVDIDGTGDPLEATVLAGECEGRWLWVVLRPASAALLLRDEWLLADVTGFGPQALEMPFGGTPSSW